MSLSWKQLAPPPSLLSLPHTSGAGHQWCRTPVHPSIGAWKGEGWGSSGSRVQCRKEAEITGVCVCLDLPVLEVGWGLELMQLLA